MKTDKKNNKNKKEDVPVDEQLSVCQEELQEWKDKFVRVSADLENFRRRMEKEKLHWMHVAQAQVIRELLAVVDNFDRALDQQDQELDASTKDWLSGFDMIRKSLVKALQEAGLEEIEIVESRVFDPTLHEAVAQVDSDEHESGEIVEALQKGYLFKDQVLRPVKVSVAK